MIKDIQQIIDAGYDAEKFKKARETRATFTFVITEECNFRCKYCYMTQKNNHNIMSFETAKVAVDYLISDRLMFPNKEVIWDFIGGEPLLEVDLMEQIIEYIMFETYDKDHPWFMNSMFSFTTNGALYGTPKVQKLIEKYGDRISAGFTIDGPEYIHDLERKFPDGSGTHESVIKNVPIWLKKYPNSSTKVTISHNNLPFIVEAVLYLFSLGIKTVHINVVFENVWEAGDSELLEQQLDTLGNIMIEKEYWKDYKCSFFNKSIGNPIPNSEDNNWCGAGKHMLAIDAGGNIHPCVRFLEFCLSKKQPIVIGNINEGIDLLKLKPFFDLTRSSQSSKKCMECDIASGCAWCQGFNYDEAPTSTINHRATYICEMHRARVRANKKYWKKIDNLEKEVINGKKL